MKRRRFFLTALTAGLSSRLAKARGETADKSRASPGSPIPRIMFTHDSRHPAVYMYEPPMEREEFEAAVDELAGTPVDALMFGLADGRTFFHDTKVSEIWGDPIRKWPHLIFRRARQNVKMMLDRGQDPLRIVCERARAKGMRLYPTLLVNQWLFGDSPQDDVRASDFRWKNRHLEIGAAGDLEEFPGKTHLDFKHEAVREERLAVIREVLNNYPVDGFELHLNYAGPFFFHPDRVADGRGIMSSWVAQVHQAVKASGAERELVITVPVDLERAWSRGLDVRQWIRDGSVDVLVGMSHNSMDHVADFRPLVQAARGSSCRVYAALNGQVYSDRLQNADITVTRAGACNYWAQGVDGLYLDFWYARWPYQASFYEQLREAPHPDVMAAKDKFYFVPTRAGTRLRSHEPPLPLPRKLNVGRAVAVDLEIADDLSRWDRTGRVHEVLLRLRVAGTTELDRLRFTLNGRVLPEERMRKINQMYTMRSPRRQRVAGYWFIFRPHRELWPRQGGNRIEVTLLERDPEVTPPIELRDVELEVRYLRGKNSWRGRDPDDLGRNETIVRLGPGARLV